LVAGQFLLLLALAVAARLDRASVPVVAGRIVAVVCALYAAWTGLAGVLRLGRHLTPLPQPKAGGQLQTTGIYARLRHPLYASTVALALGWTLWWQSPWSAGLTLALAGWLHLKVRFEEAGLRRHFPGYAAYARRVPRYFPKLRQPPAPSSKP
jgi:protein-S-isoprenylcysteine O-methyltransferase Ste14